MLRFVPSFAILTWLGLLSQSVQAVEPDAAEKQFVESVLPVLQNKCWACHDPKIEKQFKADLDLTSRAGMIAGGDSGVSVLDLKQAKQSLIYRSIVRTDDEYSAMPPKENDKLSDAETQAVLAWIEAGAPWPNVARIEEIRKALRPAGVTVKTSGGLSEDWTNRTYNPADLWAYQPLGQHKANTTIDSLLNSAMSQTGLNPAPRADRRTLIRRVTFDLIGLPPTPKEIDAFVQDPDSEEIAFAKVVDRLMASPHYGEHLAQHWLDVVRYADSAGFANDFERGTAWRYRDYVVRSFNADKTFDRFAQEQLAGDELFPNDPESLIAVGFLRMGAWELTGMEVAKVARQRFLDDVTDSVGQVFLGHMLQCARCHDHKFDPIPTKDYYSIQAVFATTQIAERNVEHLPSENRKDFSDKKYLQARQRWLQRELKQIQERENAARQMWAKANPDAKGEKPPRHEFLSARDLGMERITRKGLQSLQWEMDRYQPFALSVYTGPTPNLKAMYTPFRMPENIKHQATLEVSAILTGGDPFSPAAKVQPGVISAAGDTTLPATPEGRRAAFAQWMTSAENPLFARVIANRVWQWTMGQPIAGNPNNFGATGKKPTHPELLDWLALELIRQQWSIKSLQRQILLSHGYARSATHPQPGLLQEKDPNRTSYAVFVPRRLTAEELRDSILASSGELNRMVGGPPIAPEMNREVAHQPRQVMGTFAPVWEPSPLPSQRHRRSLYIRQLRGLRDPLLEVFNQPSPELSCERRDLSTVAPQALALFNSEQILQRSLAFAKRVLQETPSDSAAITRLFRLALGRAPQTDELKLCLDHWQTMTKRHQTVTLQKPEYPTKIQREAVEENTGEKFTYTEELMVMKDFVPDAHPADADARTRGLMEVALLIFNLNEFLYLD